jgi:hypothetical protein
MIDAVAEGFDVELHDPVRTAIHGLPQLLTGCGFEARLAYMGHVLWQGNGGAHRHHAG